MCIRDSEWCCYWWVSQPDSRRNFQTIVFVLQTAIGHELLPIFAAVKKWKCLIDGMSTTVFTDHKPIVGAFNSNKPRSSDRQQRQLSFISEYISDIVYIAGKDNVVADALSRSENAQLSNLTQFNHETDSLDLIAIARAQAEPPELYADYVKIDIGLPNINFFCETSQPNSQPVIPEHLRRGIFDLLHGLSLIHI